MPIRVRVGGNARLVSGQVTRPQDGGGGSSGCQIPSQAEDLESSPNPLNEAGFEHEDERRDRPGIQYRYRYLYIDIDILT